MFALADKRCIDRCMSTITKPHLTTQNFLTTTSMCGGGGSEGVGMCGGVTMGECMNEGEMRVWVEV